MSLRENIRKRETELSRVKRSSLIHYEARDGVERRWRQLPKITGLRSVPCRPPT